MSEGTQAERFERRRYQVLDVPIDAVSPAETVERIEDAVVAGGQISVVFCTVSSILSARDSAVVKVALEDASIVAPDGMPLIWIGRKNGYDVQRTYGPDLMLDVFSQTGGRYRHYFYGGNEGVPEAMSARLLSRFPDLVVAGYKSPPADFNPTDPPREDLQAIRDASPDILWIGLGHPKQEIFMRHVRRQLAVPVLAAVGAAFDFHAGRKKEAPEWMKVSGLQWMHRLISEPRRLWRRYLVGNTRFVLLLVKQTLDRSAAGR